MVAGCTIHARLQLPWPLQELLTLEQPHEMHLPETWRNRKRCCSTIVLGLTDCVLACNLFS